MDGWTGRCDTEQEIWLMWFYRWTYSGNWGLGNETAWVDGDGSAAEETLDRVCHNNNNNKFRL